MDSFHLIFSPHPQLLIRLINTLHSGDFGEDGIQHYLPFVEQMKAYRSKFESLNKDLLKYKKTADMLNEMDRELQFMEKDDVLQQLLRSIITTNRTLQQSLSLLEPMMKTQIEQIKSLSDYVCPPTEEVFRQKVVDMLTKAKVETLPTSVQKQCAVCFDAPANIIYKRHCTTNPHTTTIPNQSNSSHNHHSSSSSGRSTRRVVSCSGRTCACGPTLCQECLIKHYWVSSNNTTKSYSTCVCCRGEFCLKDVHLVQYIDDKEKDKEKEKNTIDNTSGSSSSSSSKGKRKESEPETTTTTTTNTSPTKKKQKNEPTSPLKSKHNNNNNQNTSSSSNNNNNRNRNDENNNYTNLNQRQRNPHSNQHHREHSRYSIRENRSNAQKRDNVINLDDDDYSRDNLNTNTTTTTTNRNRRYNEYVNSSSNNNNNNNNKKRVVFSVDSEEEEEEEEEDEEDKNENDGDGEDDSWSPIKNFFNFFG